VAEWARDGDAKRGTSCDDCIDATDSQGERRARGGSFRVQPSNTLRAAAYFTWAPNEPTERIGLRCARPPD
jgi:hypothetical protein